MKKQLRLHFFLIVALLCQVNQAQQLPLTSTSSNPVWYYIQVKGSDNGRENLVFTAEGTEVHGRAMLDGVANASAVPSQLWRFENAGENYVSIINKSTGQQIGVAYDASRSIGYASLTNTSDNKFKFVENTSTEGYYTIQSAVPASGGSSSEIYLHQANTGGSRDYIIMLVGTDYGFGANSAFTFVLYNDYTIEYSDEANEIWYNIISWKTGVDNVGIKDNSQSATPLSLPARILVAETLQQGDPSQQWKVVKNAVTGEVSLINRQTGKSILPQSFADGAYNIPELGATAGTYTLTYIGLGQYVIAGVEEDAVTRYLHLSSYDEEPQAYEAKNAKDSGFAWLFRKASDGDAINVQSKDGLKISVINGQIFVNAENYTVTAINGVAVKKNVALPSGVYLVSANGITTKVLVK
ncbi:MAG: RICIN domain-containing protein [Prevotella sp.]|jgi:hypothetical protein|nr:RICIN domain-containing protein [Prevotella sp.]